MALADGSKVTKVPVVLQHGLVPKLPKGPVNKGQHHEERTNKYRLANLLLGYTTVMFIHVHCMSFRFHFYSLG